LRNELFMERVRDFLVEMEKTFSPLKKLENILGAVAAIDAAVCYWLDSKNLSKHAFNKTSP